VTSYEEVIQKIIQKFIDTQGAPVVVRQANKSDEVEVDDDGQITDVGDGEQALADTMDNFSGIMGPVAYAMASRAIDDEDLSEINLPEDLEEKL
jgi:hypothetical protein